MLFSDELKEYEGVVPENVKAAIQELCFYYSLSEVRVLSIDENRIVIPVTIGVNLPSGGTINNIDIRAKEPILVRFTIDKYPGIAPAILSDRKDFPKDHLSHLYASRKGEPAPLCLVRGNIHEWFGTKRLENFLEIADEWFFKAANGLLNEDGNEFDPLRLDNFNGYHVYRYDNFKKVIEEKNSFLPEGNFACFLTLGGFDESGITFKSDLPVQIGTITTILNTITELKRKHPDKIKDVPLVSVLVWNKDEKIYSNYETDFPTNYELLKSYFNKYEINIDLILRELQKVNYIPTKGVPIIHAIKRPKKLIGFNGLYEFVNFQLTAESNKKGGIDPNSMVNVQSHIEPFTSELANKVSGETINQSTLFIGAGSLGSKIILHHARSGNSYVGVCDNDDFLQHNLVRHALFTSHVGKNKADVLTDELRGMFEFTPGKSIESYPYSLSFLSDEKFNNYNWIIDSTASFNVRNLLADKTLPEKINIAKCEIADQGNLGFLYVEGVNRNPRIDDLANLSFYRALKYPALEKWRRSDVVRGESTLDIGLGCSSVTSIMADDTISIHAALFSKILIQEKERTTLKEKGLFYFQALTTQGIPETYSRFKMINRFDVYDCREGSGWQVRMLPGIKGQLLSQCKRFKPNETGGVLVGVANYKTKTIHVFEALNAPSNSKRTPVIFVRGNAGLPQRIDEIKEKTGNIIGYVGEWHTHPMQLERLSARDKKTVDELIPLNRKTPIPTLSLIVTNTDLLPFIFL